MKLGEFELDKVYCIDALEGLKRLPDECVDCIITSPPYWGLRDYGEAAVRIWDGDPDCEHEWKALDSKDKAEGTRSYLCTKCGAWRGQLGLEPTLQQYLDHMLLITAELKRVLKPTGVMFWDHGNSYGGTGPKGRYADPKYPNGRNLKDYPACKGWAHKCLTDQNFRLSIRMVDEQGWIKRNNIVWYKPNHLPESVKDRFTRAYETVFMFTKSKKYWFDLDAVREVPKFPVVWSRKGAKKEPYTQNNPRKRWGLTKHEMATNKHSIKGKNPGEVWEIPTQAFPEAHFATFPEKLVERCMLAGCPAEICNECGTPRVRIIKQRELKPEEITDELKARLKRAGANKNGWYNGQAIKDYPDYIGNASDRKRRTLKAMQSVLEMVGWSDCGCSAGFHPGVVLDPFMGAGTVGVVAKRLGRHFLGFEINEDYVLMAEKRINSTPSLMPYIQDSVN